MVFNTDVIGRLVGIRHLQAALLFLGSAIVFTMRVNISMAVVAMTDQVREDHFNWTIQTQSVILSSYSWGYVALQIPGSWVVERFGGKWPIVVTIGVNSLVSLLSPMAAKMGGWKALCACRVLQGLTQGWFFPSIHTLIGRWVPVEEKNRIGTFIYSGAQFGTALELLVAGLLASHWGWEAIFYCNGASGVIWCFVYIVLGANSPRQSKIISVEERKYIQESLGQVGERKKYPTPWVSILTSSPFLALILAFAGMHWGLWTLMSMIPTYMKHILGVEIKTNGLMSSLPYWVMFLVSFPFGYLSDLVVRKKWLSLTATRKISTSIGFFGPALALICLSYAPRNTSVAVVLLVLAVGLNAGYYTGILFVHIDMAPNFAGVMMGFTNCFGTVIAIIVPLVAGLLLKDEESVSDWRKVFLLSAVMYIATCIYFLVFGTSERQSWNEPCDDKKKEKEQSKDVHAAKETSTV